MATSIKMNLKTISFSIATTILTLASTIVAPMPVQAQAVTPTPAQAQSVEQTRFNSYFMLLASKIAEQPKFATADNVATIFEESPRFRSASFESGKRICSLKALGWTQTEIIAELQKESEMQGTEPRGLEFRNIAAAITVVAAKKGICPGFK